MASPLGQVRLEEMMTWRPEASMPARSILGLAPQSVQYMYLGTDKGGLTSLPVNTQWGFRAPTVLGFLSAIASQLPVSVSSPAPGLELSEDFISSITITES